MSEESEDYITPIFPGPLESEAEETKVELSEDGDDVELDEEDDYMMVGGAARRLWPTIEKHNSTFLTMFEKGYSTTIGGVFLPPLTLRDLVTSKSSSTKKAAKFEEGNESTTTFDIVKDKISTIEYKKTFYVKRLTLPSEMKEYPTVFTKNASTTPVFFLSAFLTEALLKASELDAKTDKITEDEQNELYLRAEIIVRLYILSYINIFSQNQLCIDKPAAFSLYKQFVEDGKGTVKKFSELTAALKDDIDRADT